MKEIWLYFYFTSKFKIFSEYQCLYLPTGIALQGQANKKSIVGKIIFNLKILFLSESNWLNTYLWRSMDISRTKMMSDVGPFLTSSMPVLSQNFDRDLKCKLHYATMSIYSYKPRVKGVTTRISKVAYSKCLSLMNELFLNSWII